MRSPEFDAYISALILSLPVTQDEVLRAFSTLWWHQLDKDIIDRIDRPLMADYFRRRSRYFKSEAKKIDNKASAAFLILETAGFVDKEGKILQKGREYLLQAHPRQSQIWLALRDVWSSRVGLLVTIIGLLSGALALAQWLGWLPQHFSGG